MEKVSLNNNINNIVSNLTDDLVNDLTESNPTVTTDKDDYAPGETAEITGSGFTPGSEVVIEIVDDPQAPGDDGDVDEYQPISVIVDEFGSFSTTWFVPIDDDGTGSGTPDALNATLFLTAKGAGADGMIGTSDDQVAETTFTDAGRPSRTTKASASTSGGNDGTDILEEVSITLVSEGIADAFPDNDSLGLFPGAVAFFTKTRGTTEFRTTEFSFINLDLKVESLVSFQLEETPEEPIPAPAPSDEVVPIPAPPNEVVSAPSEIIAASISYQFLDNEGEQRAEFFLNFSEFAPSPYNQIPDAQTLDDLVNNLSFISANLFSTFPVESFTDSFFPPNANVSLSNTTDEIPTEPVATDNTAIIGEDSLITLQRNLITDDDGSGVDYVPQGGDRSVSEIAGESDPNTNIVGTYGILNWNTDGSYTYELNNEEPVIQSLGFDDTLSETFTYTLIDGLGGSDTADLTVTIIGRNDSPVLLDDNYRTEQNTPLTVSAADGVLSNDSDIDANDTITVFESDEVSQFGGSVAVNLDGSFTYIPDADFAGIDTFTYAILEDVNNPNNPRFITATVTIDVAANINGTRRDDEINGTEGRDLIAAKNGNDLVNAGGGNDTVEGGRGGDIVSGGAGDDVLAADRVDRFDDFDGTISELQGNAGNDTLIGGRKNDLLIGDSGNDSILGKSGDDELRGGRDDDLLNGGVGNDLIQGGQGIDTADYSDLAIKGVFGTVAGLDANLETGEFKHSSTNNALTWIDTVRDIENVTGTQRNDRFVNKDSNNIFDGQGEVGRSARQTTFESIFTDGSYSVIADVVEYQGNSDLYSFAGDADNFKVTGNSQTDTLIDIEFVKFNDGVFATSELNFV